MVSFTSSASPAAGTPSDPSPGSAQMAPRPPCSLATLQSSGPASLRWTHCCPGCCLSGCSVFVHSKPEGKLQEGGIAVLWVPIPGTGSGTWLMPSQCRLHELTTRLWRRALAGALPRVPPPSLLRSLWSATPASAFLFCCPGFLSTAHRVAQRGRPSSPVGEGPSVPPAAQLCPPGPASRCSGP